MIQRLLSLEKSWHCRKLLACLIKKTMKQKNQQHRWHYCGRQSHHAAQEHPESGVWRLLVTSSYHQSKGPKPFYLRLTIFFIQTTFRQLPYTQICTHWKYDTVLCARNTRDNICVKGITPASNTKEITLQITMLVVSF